jgi:hypothetical protein
LRTTSTTTRDTPTRVPGGRRAPDPLPVTLVSLAAESRPLRRLECDELVAISP